MSANPTDPTAGPGPWLPTSDIAGFPSTRWTLVQQAAGEDTLAGDALEALCRDYWYPLYVFARRHGHKAHDAQDLTQGFFAYLIRGNYLAKADRDRGRLRSYLLGGLKHFMAAEWRKSHREKRGGGEPHTPFFINGDEAEERLAAEPGDDSSLPPDQLYDRRWALAVLDRVLARLEAEFREKDHAAQFDGLSQFLGWNAGEETYAEAAANLGMKEGAIKVAVHRMRKRYGELLRDEIAQTVSSPAEIQEELDTLIASLR